MKTDQEIRDAGFAALAKELNIVEAEKFIALIRREKFDYTEWQKNLFENMSVRDLSQAAHNYWESSRS